MRKPQVTVTFGSSGQRVVKESWGRDSDRGRGNRSNAPVPFDTNARYSHNNNSNNHNNNKRMREDDAYDTKPNDVRRGGNDLRVKLMRKKMCKRMEVEDEERKKVEQHEKLSRAIESLDKSLAGNRPLLRRAAAAVAEQAPQFDPIIENRPLLRRGVAAEQSPQVESMRVSYPSWTSYKAAERSPERVPRFSSGIVTPRGGVDERQYATSMRQINALRTERAYMSDHPLEISRQNVGMPTTLRRTVDTGNMGRPVDTGNMGAGFSTATADMARPAYTQSQPMTVGSFLNSLDLGKFSISFQAEEIDMLALTQMGDADLKELGIPMGPRKKILLGLQARMKRPVTTQPQGSYVQIMRL